MKKKILIVEDDFMLRDLYREIINEYFPWVSIVMGISGNDGWREFLESRPDLVVTDLRMETNDAGLEIARKIKVVSPNTPIIMITGESVEGKVEGKEVDWVLPKPFKVGELISAIKNLIIERKEA